MSEIIQAVRGMNVVLPAESAAWQALERAARETFAAYGYREIRVPLLDGESITTAEVRVEAGPAVVTLGPGGTGLLWQSTLAESPAIALRAPGRSRCRTRGDISPPACMTTRAGYRPASIRRAIAPALSTTRRAGRSPR